MRNRRPIAAALSGTALLMALGACGQREDLKPVADQAPPVTPIGATRPPTNEELTTPDAQAVPARSDELLKGSEEHTSELQSLMRISYAVFCLKKKKYKLSKHNCELTHNRSTIV